MLVPGIRLIERPGALHLFDGRRVVSITGDEAGRAAIRAVIGNSNPAPATGPGSGGKETSADELPADEARDDARRLLSELRLIVADEPDASTRPGRDRQHGNQETSADFVSAATDGWVPAPRALRQLREVTVHVLNPSAEPATGPAGPLTTALPAAALVASLAATGIRTENLTAPDGIARLDPRHDIVAAVAADDDPCEQLLVANAACVRANVPLLPIGGYDGSRIHVGPLVIPHQSACLDCTLRRAAANVTYSELFDAVRAAPVAPTPLPLRQWAAAVASLVLLRWVGGADARMPGRLFTLVPDDLQIRQSVVYRVPRCHVCSAPDFTVRAAPWEPARDH